eukprot:1618518-Pyramimonas_sp.AAC.1
MSMADFVNLTKCRGDLQPMKMRRGRGARMGTLPRRSTPASQRFGSGPFRPWTFIDKSWDEKGDSTHGGRGARGEEAHVLLRLCLEEDPEGVLGA